MILRSVAILGLAVAAAAAATAHDYAAGKLRIRHAWITPAAAGAPTTAAYLTIVNTGDAPDRLVAVEVKDARSADIHRSTMDGGVMRMRKLDDGLVIAPGGTVTLAPGGDHVMVMGLTHALKPGDRTPAVLTFAHAGKVKVTLDVQRFADTH